MEEQTFLSERGVTITNTRLIVPGETYAMSGVTSVTTLKHKPSRWGPGVLIGLGVMALFGASASAITTAVVFLAMGVGWWLLQKPTYSVVLKTASGETEALSSKDEAFIARVVNAVNESIVSRG